MHDVFAEAGVRAGNLLVVEVCGVSVEVVVVGGDVSVDPGTGEDMKGTAGVS